MTSITSGISHRLRPLASEMRREIMEEVAAEEISEAAVALINDDSTDVGYVHFGVVHVMHVRSENVAGRRSGIVAPEFVPFDVAVKEAESCESWSRFCLEGLDMLLAKAAEALRIPSALTLADARRA